MNNMEPKKNNNSIMIGILLILVVAVSFQFYYMKKIDDRMDKQLKLLSKNQPIEKIEKTHLPPPPPSQVSSKNKTEPFPSHQDMRTMFFETYKHLLDHLCYMNEDEEFPPYSSQDIKSSLVDEDNPYLSFFGDAIKINKNDKQLNLNINLPNVDKDSLRIFYKDGYLTINGESSFSKEEKDSNGHIIRSMKKSGNFSKSFELPTSVKESSMKTDYNNGILNITFDLDKHS